MEQSNLDVDMSYLEINEKKRRLSGLHQDFNLNESSFSSDETDENIENPRRSGRKRIRPLETENRRVVTKPKKLVSGASSKETISYYLDKRVKRLPPTLETIFEEPKSDSFMSSRKFKRCIQFPEIGLGKDKVKVKKRIMKSKRVFPIKRLKKKVSMDLLMQKLLNIEESDQNIVAIS